MVKELELEFAAEVRFLVCEGIGISVEIKGGVGIGLKIDLLEQELGLVLKLEAKEE